MIPRNNPHRVFTRFGLPLFLFILCAVETVSGHESKDAVEWTRLRPLSHNPALNSGTPLARPCIPGETVTIREATEERTQGVTELRKGQFVVCIGNTKQGLLKVVDGPGMIRTLARDSVNATRGFPENWLAFDRDYLVWAYSRDTIVIRESLDNSYEGNFLYLLLDYDQNNELNAAMLIDSGTGYADLKPYIMPLIGDSNLVIVSTHNHWDHFGGHRHFMDMKNVTLLGYRPKPVYEPYPDYDLEGLKTFFSITGWPDKNAGYSIGGRNLTIIPAPGHTPDSIAIYDPRERLLFTGDTVYPGNLFIENWHDAEKSLARLQAFADNRKIKWLLGGHVEMSKKRPWNGKYQYFHFGTNTHHDEHQVNLPESFISTALAEVRRMMRAADGNTPVYDANDIDNDFHSLPVSPVPFPGIAGYYRQDANRLVEELRRRHAVHDRSRHED